jgi:hypothetical protein
MGKLLLPMKVFYTRIYLLLKANVVVGSNITK